MTGGSGAPWWGVPVIAGGFLIIGALIGFYFNGVLDSRRAERALAERFYEKVLDYSSTMTNAADEMFGATTAYATYLELSTSGEHRTTLETELSKQMVGHLTVLVEVHSSLLLVAPNAIRAAAMDLMKSTHKLFQYDHDPAALKSASVELKVADEAFQRAVRTQFGIID